MRKFARSDYGQRIGQMYAAANVTGPTEFGDLPLSDQVFWSGWMEGRVRRESDSAEEIEEMMGGLT